MEKNSFSYSRVSAWLVVHQITELQLTAPLQKVLQSFITGPDISSRFTLKLVSGASAGTLSLCGSGEGPVNIQ